MAKTLLFLGFSLLYLSSHSYPAKNLEKLRFEALDSICNSLSDQGKYNEAIAYTLIGRKKANIEFGEMDSTYAKFTASLAELYRITGRYEEAKTHMNEALAIFEKIFGKNHHKYINTLNTKAILYKNWGRYTQAELLYLETLKIAEKVLGKSHIDYKVYLENLSLVYQEMGRFEQAESIMLQTLKISSEKLGKYHTNYAASLHNLASLYRMMGYLEQAESITLESLKIRAKILGKNHPIYASSLNSLAVIYYYMGKYKQAEPLFQECLKIRANTIGNAHPRYVMTLNNLAKLYQIIGYYQHAEALQLKVLEILTTSVGKGHPDYATALHNLAQTYQGLASYKQAEFYFQEALLVRKKSLGLSHPLCSNTYISLANLNVKMGQYQQARQYAHQVIHDMSYNDYWPRMNTKWVNQLKSYDYLSNLHLLEIEKALACLFEIESIERNPNTKKRQLLLANLAMHLLKRSRNEYINDKDKLRLLAESHNWMLRSLDVLDLNKDFQQAFANVEFHKSVLLMEATKAVKAYQLGDLPDTLVAKERLFQMNQAELQAQLLKKRPVREKDSLRTLLNELNLQINSFKKQVEKEYPKYTKQKYQNYTPTVPEIQYGLDNDQAIVEYVLGDSMIYAFYIDKGHTQTIKLPIRIDTLNNRVKALHQTLSDFTFPHKSKQSLQTYQTYSKNAYWCYEQLLKPILNGKVDIKHLIIIPDGALGHLPFESFLIKKAPSSKVSYSDLDYLISDYRISYHYSGSLWNENKNEPKRQNNGQIIAMAGHYDTQPDSASMELRLPAHRRLRSGLNTLPAAKLEVEALAQEFKGFFGLDTLATERIFKEKADQFSIIHLAMHGILNKKFPTLSSLVFTEDQDSMENNILQAYEISKLNLNADLVVLSACQTGYGKFEKGNGVASLARSFMYAGVPSLVVSLWLVDDLVTSKIMKYFYLNLASGMNKAEALRQAKLTYIKNAHGSLAHPAYWSSFIQIGNSKPVKIERKYAYTPWYIGIVVMCLVAGLVFWNRKRIF